MKVISINGTAFSSKGFIQLQISISCRK